MKKSYSPEAIVRILQDVQPQLAAGASLRDLARQIGINSPIARPLAAALWRDADPRY